ncbi:two-component system sensor kinase [Streptomyces lincolnensis]|nr:two-component system sensor kinase [Streptomyces lincolnensis]
MIKVTAGADAPERCSQAFTVAAVAVASGVEVSLWLTGESAWFALPGRAAEFELPHAAALPDLLDSLLAGGRVTLCTQCAARRDITEKDVIDGVRSLVFAALGVAIGYLASGDAVRPITMITYFGLSILGGLWMPTTTFPSWLQDIAEWVPTHAYAALGQAIEQSQAPHAKDIAVLAVFFALFTGGAAWLYRKDTLKA